VKLTGGLLPAKRVFVDAKILNVHDRTLQREGFVAYVVEGGELGNATPVEETESDDAEVRAILFAISELEDRLRRFTIVCDHESVVSEANRRDAKKPTKLMAELRSVLKKNRGIRLVALPTNPAHGFLTEYVNRQKGRQQVVTEKNETSGDRGIA